MAVPLVVSGIVYYTVYTVIFSHLPFLGLLKQRTTLVGSSHRWMFGRDFVPLTFLVLACSHRRNQLRRSRRAPESEAGVPL